MRLMLRWPAPPHWRMALALGVALSSCAPEVNDGPAAVTSQSGEPALALASGISYANVPSGAFDGQIWGIPPRVHEILLSGDAKICEELSDAATPQSAQVMIYLFEVDANGALTPTQEPGIYPLQPMRVPAAFSPGKLAMVFDQSAPVSWCSHDQSLGPFQQGTVTLTRWDRDGAAGTFDLTLYPKDENTLHVTGTFEAPSCTVLSEACN